jgi:predicted RNA polymerase sigma factor
LPVSDIDAAEPARSGGTDPTTSPVPSANSEPVPAASTAMRDERMARHHRLLSVRAHLLEKTGDTAGAYEYYQRAATATASIAEQRYLRSRASRLRK